MPKKVVKVVGKKKQIAKKIVKRVRVVPKKNNSSWIVLLILLVVAGGAWMLRGMFFAKPLSINETVTQQMIPVDSIEYAWTFLNSSSLGDYGWNVRKDPDRATLPPILKDGNLDIRAALSSETYIYTNDILDKTSPGWGWILSDVIATGYTMTIEVDVEGLVSQAGPIAEHIMRIGVSRGEAANLVPETMMPVVTKEVAKTWSKDGSKNTFRFEFSAEEMATLIRLRCIKLTLSPYATGMSAIKIGEVRVIKTKLVPVATASSVPSPVASATTLPSLSPTSSPTPSPTLAPTPTPKSNRITVQGTVKYSVLEGQTGYYLGNYKLIYSKSLGSYANKKVKITGDTKHVPATNVSGIPGLGSAKTYLTIVTITKI